MTFDKLVEILQRMEFEGAAINHTRESYRVTLSVDIKREDFEEFKELFGKG